MGERRLEFHLFNFGSYPDIPHADELRNSAYIDLPNEYYEPLRGQWYLDSYFDTLVFGEKLGFDGILTTSQYNGPIGMTPNPNIALTWLAAKTERVLLGTLGPVMNSYQSPLRVAEDLALIDNMSGGRVFTGLPMGHGMNVHAIGTINPTTARERYWEAHDLLIKAWTEPGPFEWTGKHFHIPYVNVWPKPVQQPHPEIWIPATGSKETLEKVAKLRYTYQAFFSPRAALKRNVALFRELAAAEGYEVVPTQMAAVIFIHVAESDAQARLEAEPHLMWMMQNTIRSPNHDAFPPGHVSVRSLRGMMGGGYRDRDISLLTYDEMVAEGWAIVGSPETVTEKLEGLIDDLGVGRVIHVADMGAMPNWMVRKSLTLMAERVIPRFRPPGGAPVWADDPRPVPTHAQLGAAVLDREPAAIPEARIDGEGVVDVRVAHVPDLRTPLRP